MFRKFLGIFILLSFFFVKTGVFPVYAFFDNIKKASLEQIDDETSCEESTSESKETKKTMEDFFYVSSSLALNQIANTNERIPFSLGKVSQIPLALNFPPPEILL